MKENPYCAELLNGPRFEHYWDAISEQLDRFPAIWSWWWTKEEIRESVLRGSMSCWAVGSWETIRFIMFTTITEYERRKVLQILIAFGDGIEECIPASQAALERYAQFWECDRVEVVGRLGWRKWLRPLGFEIMSATFGRDLALHEVH